MHQKRLGYEITQEAQARDDAREGPWLRRDVQELHLEQVARTGALDEHRARQRVDCTKRDRGKVGNGGMCIQIPIECVSCFEHHRLAFVDFQDWHEIRVPAVMPRVRLLVEMPGAVDRDASGDCAELRACHRSSLVDRTPFYTTRATGRTGEPVPPRIFNGRVTNRNRLPTSLSRFDSCWTMGKPPRRKATCVGSHHSSGLSIPMRSVPK